MILVSISLSAFSKCIDSFISARSGYLHAYRSSASYRFDCLAAAKAWHRPYLGHGCILLESCINDMNLERKQKEKDNGPLQFRAFTSIIQSSGMGKSRVVDEMAKRVFTLPFNLRDPEDHSGNLSSGE